MSSVITVQNLSKEYQIYHKQQRYLAFRDTIADAIKKPIHRLTGKNNTKESFWALKDVSLSVKKGEVLGVIGANGAGKTTLLKILSRITPPTKGRAILKGRISSLLEVGTGFHPELTGRENIYLNGAILGMRRQEINKKFKEIVRFSGIEKFIDTPVKRYSSGMQVRLAFSVAAHLEPEILLIDEVLAVGDIAFQKKSLGKMERVTKKEGRTILFVSHNMAAIKRLCQKCLLLEKGRVKMISETEQVIAEYLNNYSTGKAEIVIQENKNKKIQVRKVSIIDYKGNHNTQLDICKPFQVEVEYDVHRDVEKSYVGVGLIDLNTNAVLVNTLDIDTNEALYHFRKKGRYRSTFTFNANLFNQINVKLFIHAGTFPVTKNSVDKIDGALNISFFDRSSFATRTLDGKRTSSFLIKIPCEVQKV